MDPIASAVLESWTLDWGTLFLLFVIGAVYLRGWLRLQYSAGRLVSFLSGLVAIVIALESPIDTFGSLLLQAHMIQHLLLTMVAPPLLLQGQPVLPLLRGLPQWIFKDALGPFLAWYELKRVGRAIIHPVVTWALFSSAIVIWHLPRLYDLALQSPGWHEVEHACFFWTAVLFWWPVIGVRPSKPIWPEWAMIPYLLAAGMVNMGLSAVLSFSGHALYSTYATAPRVWDITAHEDQSAAGGLMWVLGSIAMLIPAAVLGMRALEPTRPKTLPRILMPYRPKPLDLMSVPLFRHRYFRRGLQTIMLLLAIAVAGDGFFGTQVAPMNLAGVLPWIHWRGLAVIALLMAGNLFCMACPFTLPGDAARRFMTPALRWPAGLRSKWIAVGLLATYLWAYEALSLWDSPVATAWLIVGYFTAALVVDTIFKGASFCKYVCPIGQFHFVNSLVSPLQVKVRQPAACQSCTTHDCFHACGLQLFQPRKQGNFDCTFCLECVQACPQDNVGVLRAKPLEGIERLGRRPDVAALVLVLVFGAFINAAGMTDPVMMWMHHHWTGIYTAALLLPPAALVALCGHARLKDTVCSFSLTLIPIGFGMWLAHFSNHMLTWWSSSPNWIPGLQLTFLDLGLLLTLYAAWRAAGSSLAVLWPWAVLAIGLYSTGVWIVFQPMQMRGMVMG